MLLSRFWYVLLALALGASAFTLYVADQMYNHAGHRAMSDALAADSSAVGWFLRDDARKRSSATIPMALSPDIGEGLAKASVEPKIGRDVRTKVKTALTKVAADVPADLKFDAVWAVDAGGRVVASVGFDHGDDWELGGYAAVGDALHGWIRDDAWVWRGRIYRVVTRPVEREAQGEPVGAIVGAKIVDDSFAFAASKRTGAAVGFYADGARVASGAPEGFDKGTLDEITSDLKALEGDKDYQTKGRSDVRVLRQHLGVVYARHPGEAWELGAGYAVGRVAVAVSSPFDFLSQADNSDKAKVPTVALILGALLVVAAGLVFTYLEHDKPLTTFRHEVTRLAKGEIDVFQPSRFRGAFKKIASDLNDGIEKVAAKGGAPRRAADLEQVLGPIPAKPAMSAFAVPGPGGPADPPSRSIPRPPPVAERSAARLRQAPVSPPEAEPETVEETPASTSTPAAMPKPPRRPPLPGAAPVLEAPESVVGGDPFDELEDWRRVYEEFLAMKKQCTEETGSLTFEKFKGTLQRNKEALVARHNCARVTFTVYVKDGKTALKASPGK